MGVRFRHCMITFGEIGPMAFKDSADWTNAVAYCASLLPAIKAGAKSAEAGIVQMEISLGLPGWIEEIALSAETVQRYFFTIANKNQPPFLVNLALPEEEDQEAISACEVLLHLSLSNLPESERQPPSTSLQERIDALLQSRPLLASVLTVGYQVGGTADQSDFLPAAPIPEQAVETLQWERIQTGIDLSQCFAAALLEK